MACPGPVPSLALVLEPSRWNGQSFASDVWRGSRVMMMQAVRTERMRCSNFVCFRRYLIRRHAHRPTPGFDPGCVKTPKGRSRRGIVFYRRRGFRVVLQPLATTLVLEKKVILCVQHALRFDTPKTLKRLGVGSRGARAERGSCRD